MVLFLSSKNGEIDVYESELELESGQCIRYTAPAHAVIVRADDDGDGYSREANNRMRSKLSGITTFDDWEGVYELCRSMDNALRFEADDMLRGCKVLEIGFCTGLPTVLALANGSTHVTIHTADGNQLKKYVKPTLAQNNIKYSQHQFVEGNWEKLRDSTKCREFNVIFAVEIFNVENAKFDEIHDIIDYSLSDDGICLLETQMYYHNCDGSLPEFLDMVKSRGKFDIYERWSSPKSEIVQRRVIQLTRAIR